MRLLLDTHVAIWALISPRLIPTRIRDQIGDPLDAVLVSVASVWEITIKFSRGKRSAPPFSGRAAAGFSAEVGYTTLPIRPEHAVAVGDLPPLHTDPFDRMLVAQALTEPLRIVTADPGGGLWFHVHRLVNKPRP